MALTAPMRPKNVWWNIGFSKESAFELEVIYLGCPRFEESENKTILDVISIVTID